MKPLILMLLVSVSVQAQSVADTARKERARQAQTRSVREFTDNNSHTIASVNAPAKLSSVVAEAPTSAAVTTANAEKALADDQIQKLRAKVRDLEDQEVALKLQINEASNQVYAPVTTQDARTAAQNKLGDLQNKLIGVQKDLAQTRATLQQMEAQAAPTPAAPKK